MRNGVRHLLGLAEFGMLVVLFSIPGFHGLSNEQCQSQASAPDYCVEKRGGANFPNSVRVGESVNVKELFTVKREGTTTTDVFVMYALCSENCPSPLPSTLLDDNNACPDQAGRLVKPDPCRLFPATEKLPSDQSQASYPRGQAFLPTFGLSKDNPQGGYKLIVEVNFVRSSGQRWDVNEVNFANNSMALTFTFHTDSCSSPNPPSHCRQGLDLSVQFSSVVGESSVGPSILISPGQSLLAEGTVRKDPENAKANPFNLEFYACDLSKVDLTQPTLTAQACLKRDDKVELKVETPCYFPCKTGLKPSEPNAPPLGTGTWEINQKDLNKFPGALPPSWSTESCDGGEIICLVDPDGNRMPLKPVELDTTGLQKPGPYLIVMKVVPGQGDIDVKTENDSVGYIIGVSGQWSFDPPSSPTTPSARQELVPTMITIQPSFVLRGGSTTISVEIANRSTQDIRTPFEVRFWYCNNTAKQCDPSTETPFGFTLFPDGEPFRQLADADRTVLEAGKTLTVTAQLGEGETSEAGIYQILVRIDTKDEVKEELNENNNSISVFLVIGDLIVPPR